MARRVRTTVSQVFNLGLGQGSLPFVDVDIYGDTRFHVDPRAIRLLGTQWSNQCVTLLQNYFENVLQAVKRGERAKALRLLSGLHEPNETHLGLSRGRAQGSGIGRGFARDIYDALSASDAAVTGLLEDLEDTALLIDGIDRDRISDITTNVIRLPLIQFTQRVAGQYGIPLTPGVASGSAWDAHRQLWDQGFTKLPMTPHGKLLLVPKTIVRRRMLYDAGEYERDYILPELQDIELAANSELVQLLKWDRRRVTKRAVRGKYGGGKQLNRRVSIDHPEVLVRYRRDKNREGVGRPLDHDAIADATETAPPDWDALLDGVRRLETGTASATAYHRAMAALLEALFYPELINPIIERQQHEGRKRVDITYDNVATRGFFNWLRLNYPSMMLFVECKNYTADPANPELDQLAGRFGPSKGRVGILCVRGFTSPARKARFLQGCKDTAKDQRGFILVLDDEDLGALVEERQGGSSAFAGLRLQFDALL